MKMITRTVYSDCTCIDCSARWSMCWSFYSNLSKAVNGRSRSRNGMHFWSGSWFGQEFWSHIFNMRFNIY